MRDNETHSSSRQPRLFTAALKLPAVAAVCGIIMLCGAAETSATAKPEQAEDVVRQLVPAGQFYAAVRSSRESQAAEMAFWETIKDSKNPAEYEAYLQAFPDGIFAPLARARIRLYRAAPAESAPAAQPAPAPAPAPQPVPQAAPTPAPAPEPAPEPELAIDKVDGNFIARTDMNVRGGPTTKTPPIATISRGAPVDVQGKVQGRDWYQVRTPDGKTGFVAAGLVLEVQRQAPTPAPAPAPAPAQQAAVPAASGETFKDCDDCPEMVTLPAGKFEMGSRAGDPSERPVTRVSIAKPFAIGRFEVTVAQWAECRSAGACTFEPRATDQPERTAIRNLSWDDASDYVKWLSQKTGRKYRLPTEAEWEYAARGGTSTRYWWGDRPNADKANCKDCGGPWSRKAPAPIGSHDANQFGLHDMNGGVAEWTADCWQSTLDGASRDGSARQQDRCTQRVLRGGSWRNEAAYLRSSARLFYDANVRYLVNGFRVAADAN